MCELDCERQTIITVLEERVCPNCPDALQQLARSHTSVAETSHHVSDLTYVYREDASGHLERCHYGDVVGVLVERVRNDVTIRL